MNTKPTIEEIRALAKRVGFREIEFQENIGMVSFYTSNEEARVNVYLTKMTVVVNFKASNSKAMVRKRLDSQNLKTMFEYLSEVSRGLIKK